MTKRKTENVKYSIYTHTIEKLIPSREAIRIGKHIVDGRLSGDKAVEQITRYYGLESRLIKT